MINTATSFLALLQEEDPQMKSMALEKINLLIDDHWPEISDHLRLFKDYYEKNAIEGKQKLLALILSKLYYNLEDYTEAVEWALKSEDSFDIKEKSLYVNTILKKMLDKYIEVRKYNFFHRDKAKPIDKRINAIIENVFNNCLKNNRLYQALGFCVESYDLDRLTKAIESSKDVLNNINFESKKGYEDIYNFLISKKKASDIINKTINLNKVIYPAYCNNINLTNKQKTKKRELFRNKCKNYMIIENKLYLNLNECIIIKLYKKEKN
jgi:hypothetical protein